ncbi:dihydroxyacetone kinase subunit L [Rhizobium sp. 16-488-2a]|nr:dihydroxyacetone kinase subunit L [Rhizobium sp. 16-488-2b]MBO9178183.1 dihydroxyacetone kinase subunit L [Rhizobium sp. 16-488-2a]
MITLEAELNDADSKLGDGDTGVMLTRVLNKFAETEFAGCDLGNALQTLARAAAAATGSSLGTLFATALLTIGRMTKGNETAQWDELAGWLKAALEAMIQRGGASLGDKTVLDAMDGVAKAIEGLDSARAISKASSVAANRVLDDFRSKPCKIGRARMFAEKSVGIDDPGMLGFVRLIDALADGR